MGGNWRQRGWGGGTTPGDTVQTFACLLNEGASHKLRRMGPAVNMAMSTLTPMINTLTPMSKPRRALTLTGTTPAPELCKT